MNKEEFKQELVLRLSQGVAQGGGVDKAAIGVATEAIFLLADSIADEMFKEE